MSADIYLEDDEHRLGDDRHFQLYSDNDSGWTLGGKGSPTWLQKVFSYATGLGHDFPQGCDPDPRAVVPAVLIVPEVVDSWLEVEYDDRPDLLAARREQVRRLATNALRLLEAGKHPVLRWAP